MKVELPSNKSVTVVFDESSSAEAFELDSIEVLGHDAEELHLPLKARIGNNENGELAFFTLKDNSQEKLFYSNTEVTRQIIQEILIARSIGTKQSSDSL